MPIPDTTIQEQLSISYLNAVISYAGFSFQDVKASADFGIDGMLMLTSMYDNEYHSNGAVLNIQLKATHTARVSNDKLHYDLKVRAYERLKAPSVLKKILIIYVMPKDKCMWLEHDIKKLMLCECAFWIDADSLPALNGQKETITIKIPLTNIFNTAAIEKLTTPIVRKFSEAAL